MPTFESLSQGFEFERGNMTPEERAGFIVGPYIGVVPCPEALAELIAEQIRQAIQEEREACAKTAETQCKNWAACADAIRERK